MMNEEKKMKILFVEDNPRDVECFLIVCERSDIFHNIHVVKNGEEALDFLLKRKKYVDAPEPSIVFLDLNLPKMNGIQVLQKIKNDPKLLHIPVIVLTSSKSEQDILKTYNLHANSYLVKPVDLKQFEKTIKAIRDFWFDSAILPKKSKSGRG